MNHNWKESVFNCDDVFEGVRTCTQLWLCANCEKTIILPYGIKPCVPGECIDTREERAKAAERAAEIKARKPKTCRNGKKARRS